MGGNRSLLSLVLISVLLFDHLASSQGQRSLNYWKHDLEHRIRLYESNHNAIKSIIGSSIYAPQGTSQAGGPEVRVPANGNVRFSDLIIPSGAIRLSPHILQPTVDILVKKTKSYADAKANEISLIQDQLNNVIRQLDDPRQQYIYKGVRGAPQPQKNFTHLIAGTRIFRQAQYAHFVEAKTATIQQINMTDVSRVIDDTYLRNTKLGVYDSQHRLYFEGRKTFWDSVFSKPLRSGCCDRLWPLHTSRMMLRSAAQDVAAPIMIHSRDSRSFGAAPTAHIRDLRTQQLYNRPIELKPLAPSSRADEIGLLAPTAPPSNLIQVSNLVNIRQLGQAEMLTTLVFRSAVVIDEALLANSYADNRLVIGIATMPAFAFDLAHDNYLLKFANVPANYGQPLQQVSGTLVLDTETSFFAGIQALQVNRINDFARFIKDSLVYTNRPATIRGPIQFNALPSMLDMGPPSGTSRRPQNVLILHARHGLQVGLLNGMRVPQDLVVLANDRVPGNERVALKPGQQIRVLGARNFANQLVCLDALHVSGPVNGIEMPSGVIPLHLNDVMSTTGHSNLWFMDGVSLQHVSVAGGHFDDIKLNDVNGGAQSIILNSMTMQQADGTTIIRAPLRVLNLHLINSSPDGQSAPGGRLNGFRPQEVLELNPRYPYETLYGRKHFVAPVEAAECIFNDINQLPNWTNHLIRIDRPNSVQSVHTRLVFTSTPAYGNLSNQHPEQLNLQRLSVEFEAGTEPAHYEHNWHFSPELYLLHQALMRQVANYTGGRYRVLEELKLIHPSGGLVNDIPLGDIVRLDQPFRFAGTFTMVGKVEVLNSLSADRIHSNYPIDALDLVQFDKYRIPIVANSRAPIRLNSLTLAGPDNKASFVQSRLLNGVSLQDFLESIMSLTRPQTVAGPLLFQAPVSFEGMVRTSSSVNGVKNFNQFTGALKNAKYSFEDGLQCNSVLIRT